jgi:hypothetical protein
MKYATEMGSGAMSYIPTFIKLMVHIKAYRVLA